MSNPTWTNYFTPNYRDRVPGVPIEAIILHHTGGGLQGSLATLCNPATKKSADFVIARNGKVYKLNPDLRIHWTFHAGVAELPDGHTDVNQRSVGLEQEHTLINGIWQNWPDVQIKATAYLCKWLEQSGIVMKHQILSHAQVARPKGRKTDPERYPWQKFSDYYDEAA